MEGVLCFWVYDSEAGSERPWKLMEHHLVNFPRETDQQPRRWEDWLYERDAQDPDSDDLLPRLGRAVTAWYFDSGVRLVGFHPPDWVDWLAPYFEHEIKSAANWRLILTGGNHLYTHTAQTARKCLLENLKNE